MSGLKPGPISEATAKAGFFGNDKQEKQQQR
jgi:hypothetical protein